MYLDDKRVYNTIYRLAVTLPRSTQRKDDSKSGVSYLA